MNRIFIFIFFGLCPFSSLLAAEYTIVIEDGKKGVVDELGNIVLPVVFDDLGWSEGEFSTLNEVTGFKEGGKWGIVNMSNVRVTEAAYSDLFPVNSQYLIASRVSPYSGRLHFGVLDPKGKAVVGFQYSSMAGHHGLLLVAQYRDDTEKWGVLNYQEQEVIPIQYDNIRIYPSNFVAFKGVDGALISLTGNLLTDFVYDDVISLGNFFKVIDHHGKQGLIDRRGTSVIPMESKSIELVNDSTAEVVDFNDWELISRDNKKIKTFSFDDITPISHGVYTVLANGREAMINIAEEYLVKGNDWRIEVPDEHFILVKSGGKSGVIKEGGLEVLAPEYDSIHYSGKHFYSLKYRDDEPQWQIYSTFGSLISSNVFQAVHPMTDNLIAIKKNDYWGYIDFSGHTTIEFKYDYAWPFTDGRAKVDYLGNQGVINQAGEWVVYPRHQQVTIVNEDLFINHTSSGFDLIDNTERIVYQTNHKFEPHPYGLLEVTSDGKLGLIDARGRSVLPPRYDGITKLSDQHVYTIFREDRYGVISGDGNFILPMTSEYDQILSLSEEFLSIKKNGKYGFIDLNGQLRIAHRYDAVKDFKSGLAAVKLLGRWGFIDKAERLRIQPTYDNLDELEDGLMVVTRDGLKGMIDHQGQEILPAEYDSLYLSAYGSVIVIKDERYGLANKSGELMIPPKYDLIEENEGGYLIIKKRGKYGVIDTRGIDVIPSVYDDIKYDTFNRFYLAMKSGENRQVSIKGYY